MFPFLILHWLRGRLSLKKYTRPFSERFGFIRLGLAKQGRRILVHAVSVGETVAAEPFVKALREAYPEDEIIFSNVTETGHAQAKRIIPANRFVFFPLDYSHAVNRFLRIIKPDLVFILETELWPNFLYGCQASNIPVFFINGRIGDKSYERYQLFRSLLSPYLKSAHFCMQTSEDEKRIRSLGANHVIVSGNLKYDQLLSNLNHPKREGLEDFFRKVPDPILLFGSLHQKEVNQILEMILQWKKCGREASFIIAPRHLNYLPDYQARCRELGLSFGLRSKFQGGSVDLLFLDTYGELALSYEFAQIVVIGGSFEAIGGHSILEPALFSKPVLYGPHMENNKEITRIFEERGASFRAADYQALRKKIELLLENEGLRKKLGTNARVITEEMTGSTRKCIEYAARQIGEDDTDHQSLLAHSTN